jgi:hypothetical protein
MMSKIGGCLEEEGRKIRVRCREKDVVPRRTNRKCVSAFLARSGAEGTTKVRYPFSEIRHRGYMASYSHLARFLAPWRSGGPSADGLSADHEAPAPLPLRVMGPMTGRRISPLVAAALCVKPRRQMTTRHIGNVDALKAGWKAQPCEIVR